jgi:hypothetical protein
MVQVPVATVKVAAQVPGDVVDRANPAVKVRVGADNVEFPVFVTVSV